MFSLILRGFLIAAGFVASWFVPKDAPQFGIMQMAVALIVIVVSRGGTGILARKIESLLNRVHKPPPPN
jgi:hypothetical protein